MGARPAVQPLAVVCFFEHVVGYAAQPARRGEMCNQIEQDVGVARNLGWHRILFFHLQYVQDKMYRFEGCKRMSACRVSISRDHILYSCSRWHETLVFIVSRICSCSYEYEY